MKTSNKLIAGIFLLAVLFPVLVVATIFFKYKSGNFTWEKDEHEFQTEYFPGKKIIKVRSNNGLEVYPSDSLYAEFEHRYNFPVRLKHIGDTMLLYGDTAYYHYDTARNGTVTKEYIETQTNETVRLYLPADVNLVVEYCDFYIMKPENGKQVENMNIQMKRSSFDISNLIDSTAMQVNRFTLKLDRSVLSLPPDLHIKELDLGLIDSSEVSITDSRVDQIRLSIDSTSSIKANGHQIKKIIQK